MPSTCTFNLLRANEIYFAGKDFITGKVFLNTTNNKNVTSVKIHFWGRSKCGSIIEESCWDPIVQISTSKEQFVKREVPVFGEGDLPAGQYESTFEFYVPIECPTSVESCYGHIRYEVYLEIKNKDKYKNIFIQPVTVIQIYNLNMYPDLKLNLQKGKTVSCCLGGRNTRVFYNLTTPVRAYTPGQSVQFTLEVNNKGAHQVTCYEVKLIRLTGCEVNEPETAHRESVKFLAEKNLPDDGENDQIIQDELFIPSTPPTIEVDFITVKYILEIKAKLSLCACNLEVKLPIIIGTVPLKETLTPQQLVQAQNGEEFCIRPTGWAYPYKPDEPFIDRNTLEINQAVTFLPSYPMYNFIQA